MKQTPQTVANALLQDDEQLLWAGQPDGGRVLTGYDTFLIPFMFLWSVFWAILAFLTIRAQQFVSMMGVAFVIIGVYIFASRLYFKLKRRSQVFYAITDRRIMSIRHTKEDDDVRAVPLEHVESATVSPGQGSGGTIYFVDDAGGRTVFYDVQHSEDVFQTYRKNRKQVLEELRQSEDD